MVNSHTAFKGVFLEDREEGILWVRARHYPFAASSMHIIYPHLWPPEDKFIGGCLLVNQPLRPQDVLKLELRAAYPWLGLPTP